MVNHVNSLNKIDTLSTKSVHNYKFTNSTALFGFYEWLNIVASQQPENEFEDIVINAFKAYNKNVSLEKLAQPIANIVRILKASFEKGV